MTALRTAAAALEAAAVRFVPRLLTHVCRDPGSPAYGACDRDWWHYKSRDFPSIILQQAGYTAWLAGRLPDFAGLAPELVRLARAAARFWAERAERRGAFEEYYPWEEGYPPVAFATLALMKLVREGVLEPSELEGAARRAARQLLDRFEAAAANQQVAGLAALAVLGRNYPPLVPPGALARLKQRTLALQSSEGWFVEYGGPDLGYLSVTLDCLWDLHDATGDPDYLGAAGKALDYLAALVPTGGDSVGMHNSRNTDYVLPYGIVRFVTDRTPRRDAAASLFARLYRGAGEPGHFLHAIDDRYVCHYSGHSLVRAALALRTLLGSPDADTALPHDGAAAPSERLFSESGQFVRTPRGGARLMISLKKGGVFSFRDEGTRAADFGWVVTVGRRRFVTHWWSDEWRWSRDESGFRVAGRLVSFRERLPGPGSHAALRVASFLFGRRIIGSLKRVLIFRSPDAPYGFERRILLWPDRVELRDVITGLPADATVAPAPRSSKRHVASADLFHREDLEPAAGIRRETSVRRTAERFEAETVYRIGPSP